jgi:hypothetical protein
VSLNTAALLALLALWAYGAWAVATFLGRHP